MKSARAWVSGSDRGLVPPLPGMVSPRHLASCTQRQSQLREACRECNHLDYCLGGCPYNTWACGDIYQVKDPYCEAYRTIFDDIRQRLVHEMNSDENIEAIADRPFVSRGHPLSRKGPLADILSGRRTHA